MKIAMSLNREIKEPVTGEAVQHMVEKGHACIDFAAAVAVEAEADSNLGLAGFAADFRHAWRPQPILTVVDDWIFSRPCRAWFVIIFHLCSKPRFGANRGRFFALRRW
jgi:hypothetical protein